jgi:hypothetical protein
LKNMTLYAQRGPKSVLTQVKGVVIHITWGNFAQSSITICSVFGIETQGLEERKQQMWETLRDYLDLVCWKPMGEGNWKMVQMKTLFHVFTHDCPMLELFVSLGVPNNPTMH